MPHGIGHEGETVRRLLESAAAEFARHGFAAARVRDIVDAAGVNLAAVNYHFGGKEGLYRATLTLLARRTQDEVPRESAEVRRLEPEEQLRVFTLVILERFLGGAQASPMARILAHELLDPTPAFHDLLRDVAGPQFERLSDIVARLLGPRANADEIALATFSITGQWAFYLLGRGALERLQPDLVRDPSVIARLAQQISDFSVAALRARRLAIESASRDASPSPPSPRTAVEAAKRPAPARRSRKAVPGKAGATP
jgi:TetR/AcrR family transcriptional regulator, regulator of cefoperazone and chloramphenicol sensitivity